MRRPAARVRDCLGRWRSFASCCGTAIGMPRILSRQAPLAAAGVLGLTPWPGRRRMSRHRHCPAKGGTCSHGAIAHRRDLDLTGPKSWRGTSGTPMKCYPPISALALALLMHCCPTGPTWVRGPRWPTRTRRSCRYCTSPRHHHDRKPGRGTRFAASPAPALAASVYARATRRVHAFAARLRRSSIDRPAQWHA